jgi:acetyl esterase/lipase
MSRTGLRTSLINLAIRGIVKPRLSACRTPFDVRRAFASMPAIAPTGVRFSQARLGGVAGEWATARHGDAGFGALLYLHGGGYAAMSARTHRAITGGFARRGFRVFAPDYRLAPEHQFPAALEDAAAAWRGLRAEVAGPVFVAGDSAGGGLAAALLLYLRDLGEAGPTAACFFSPWVDLAVTGESLAINRDRDPMQVASAFRMLAAAYLGPADPRLPLASPIYGEFAGLPPLLAFVGDAEILLDDARRLIARARLAGVEGDLRIYPDMPHAWPLLGPLLPEAGQALNEATGFMQAAAIRAAIKVEAPIFGQMAASA